MFIEQMYEEAMAVARENGGRMPYPVNCIFDEAGIMPSLAGPEACLRQPTLI